MLNAGRLAGTGKLVMLPVDQGFEHGPARSFAPSHLCEAGLSRQGSELPRGRTRHAAAGQPHLFRKFTKGA